MRFCHVFHQRSYLCTADCLDALLVVAGVGWRRLRAFHKYLVVHAALNYQQRGRNEGFLE
jgi:hypothetical protein